MILDASDLGKLIAAKGFKSRPKFKKLPTLVILMSIGVPSEHHQGRSWDSLKTLIYAEREPWSISYWMRGP